MTDTQTPVHRVHAFADDALGELDATGVAEAIRSGRASAAEAVEAAIRRAESVDPALGAIACADFDRARRAASSPAGGFFSGVPTFIKDNVDVVGLPTQEGSSAFRAQPASADGEFAASFRRLGPVCLGKTQLSEFGISASAESPGRIVRNPWCTDYSSGASSAGSAALVAAGVVPFAHGNDGGGSIRIPAAACGLVGLKPSCGRVPQDALFDRMPVKVVADGVLTRTVRDTAAYLREVERLHPVHSLPPVGDVRHAGDRSLRVAMVIESPFTPTDVETAASVREAARLLESMGHRVEEIAAPVPASFEEDFKTYYGLLFLYMNATGKSTFDRSFDWHRTESLTRGFAGYTLHRLHRLPAAIARLRASARRSRELYADYDLVLTPTVSHLTPRIGHIDPTLPFETAMERLLAWVGFTPLQNATGDAAVSLPFAISSQGTPIGIQIAGPLGSETRLLEIAYAVEEARPFARIQDGPAGRG
ncbi:amidase [Tomitella gaofuii]|uniref:amidase n=1 Tax=Tomitella gaofuii TaxID=2760083 RepID=UPI0015FD417B|nr:amidase [Tomitella gaofuii]